MEKSGNLTCHFNIRKSIMWNSYSKILKLLRGGCIIFNFVKSLNIVVKKRIGAGVAAGAAAYSAVKFCSAAEN